MLKKVILSLLMMGAVIVAAAQSTRVRGTVRDADTGEPLPFAAVYFDGTTIGISTDLNGHYTLETRSKDAIVLTASLIGYESLSINVNQGTFSEINFRLRQDPKQLEAALVKPDNRYIKSILKKLDQSLAKNDPENAPDWHARLYTKIEFDVTNMEDFLKLKAIDKSIGFVREYSDTSAITGKPYIPALISENVADMYHSQDPAFSREVMRASRISGLREDNVLRQFTGSYLLKTNFYKPNIGLFNLVIPNPAAGSSNIFYNYFLVDSLQVEGRKTYVLRFHPKKLVNSPTLDGEMQIDAEDFGIRSVHATLSGESNVNWIRHINVDIQNRRLPDGRWFYGDERLFIDFSISVRDDSRIISFLGNRQISYSMPVFEPVNDPDALSSSEAVVMRNVTGGDELYWDSARPYRLTEREQGIYRMVDEIMEQPIYKWTYGITRTLITNYYEVEPWKVEFGRYAQSFAYNDFEGFRMQIGGRTTKDLSETVRLGGYFAFGFKDLKPKGMVSAEVMFNRERTRKFTFEYKHDYVQFGGGTVFTVQNIFSSFLAKEQSKKLSMVRQIRFLYEHEFANWCNANVEWSQQRVWSNEYVPFIRNTDGIVQESFGVNALKLGLRFSIDERVNRNVFVKTSLFTKYPVLELNFTKAFPGMTPYDMDYAKGVAVITWNVPSTIVGFGHLHLEAGQIWGSAPYPMLKLHDANQTFFLDRMAYSCLKYYEFVSDRWVSGYYEHNFNGILLGKIPWVKQWDLREVATVKMAWGSLSDQNGKNAIFKLPAETNVDTIDKIPYLEVGAGISNIFRLIRVDAFWRITHRRPRWQDNFAVTVGIDVEF